MPKIIFSKKLLQRDILNHLYFVPIFSFGDCFRACFFKIFLSLANHAGRCFYLAPHGKKSFLRSCIKQVIKIQITLDYYLINICKTMLLQIEFEVALQTGNLSFLCYDDYKTLLCSFSHTQLSTTMSAGIVQELQVHALYISSEGC